MLYSHYLTMDFGKETPHFALITLRDFWSIPFAVRSYLLKSLVIDYDLSLFTQLSCLKKKNSREIAAKRFRCETFQTLYNALL